LKSDGLASAPNMIAPSIAERIAIAILVVATAVFYVFVRSMNPNRPRPAVLRKGRRMWCNVPRISTHSSSPFWPACVPDSSSDEVCHV
jgi:hypothetical protein